MSHFSACVAIPAKNLLGRKISQGNIDSIVEEILAPYWESTEEYRYMEFVDKSAEARDGYEKDTISAVRYPDGRIVKTTERAFNDKFVVVEEHIFARDEKAPNKRAETDESRTLVYIPRVPVKQLYTFEQYCEDYCGYTQDENGHWGYWHNPNARWDWYSIGGRFDGRLLAEANLSSCIPAESKFDDPHYKVVNGARMGDIAWDKLKEILRTSAETRYCQLVNAFETGNTDGISQVAVRTDDGIFGWGDVCYYKKGETLEEFLQRSGRSDKDQYILSPFAFVDKDGEWHESGTMGWFGLSANEKEERAWNDEVQAFLGQLDADDFLVILDCHI